MTDIRQHLPTILSHVRQHLLEPGTAAGLRDNLRTALPASYGIGAGRLVTAQGQQSHPFEVVIYDTTMPPAQYYADAACYDVRQALVVIAFAHELEMGMLTHMLHDIASAKQLLTPTQLTTTDAAQKPARMLKKLLPLGIIASGRLTDVPRDDPETLALALATHIKSVAERLRPDYLIAQSHQLTYSNPLLAGNPFVAGTINITREPHLKKPHPCYVCKQQYTAPHFFYSYLCARCGDLNYYKRALPADLCGRVALVTGGRIKIGYATALRLLRAGAQVIVTTRFPHDAARRYAGEADFAAWGDRLQIYGIDFRYLPVLEHFAAHLQASYPALDILINNAAQTVRYAPDYYAPLLPYEQLPLDSLAPEQQKLLRASYGSLPPTPFALPEEPSVHSHEIAQQAVSANIMHNAGAGAVLAQAGEMPDEKTIEQASGGVEVQRQNSWTLPLDEIDLHEFLEVQVINVTAPFLLVSRLLPLMRRSTFAQRFIVNVSAVEGRFANPKQGTHVHTNMAKAALNMLTHTAAAGLARERIFMNSVDPGWISQQGPLTDKANWERIERLLPLDLVDAAARICDPIFSAITTGEATYGGFYKDYQRAIW